VWGPIAELNDPTSANPIFTPASGASPVDFIVEIADTLNCTATDNVSVTVLPEVFADAGPGFSTCEGQGVVIGGVPTASGGTGALGCSWSPVQDLSDPLSCNPTCTPSGPATPLTYTVTVTDANVCRKSASVQVEVAPDSPPRSIGNTLRCKKEGSDIRFVWTLNGSYAYNVRRHDSKTFDLPTSDLLKKVSVDEYLAPGEADDPRQKLFYRVFSVNCSGAEE
jgi:hypothetical protein